MFGISGFGKNFVKIRGEAWHFLLDSFADGAVCFVFVMPWISFAAQSLRIVFKVRLGARIFQSKRLLGLSGKRHDTNNYQRRKST